MRLSMKVTNFVQITVYVNLKDSIPLYKQFNEAIKHSKEVAETMQDDPVVPITPNSGERYIGFKVDLDNI